MAAGAGARRAPGRGLTVGYAGFKPVYLRFQRENRFVSHLNEACQRWSTADSAIQAILHFRKYIAVRGIKCPARLRGAHGSHLLSPNPGRRGTTFIVATLGHSDVDASDAKMIPIDLSCSSRPQGKLWRLEEYDRISSCDEASLERRLENAYSPRAALGVKMAPGAEGRGARRGRLSRAVR